MLAMSFWAAAASCSAFLVKYAFTSSRGNGSLASRPFFGPLPAAASSPLFRNLQQIRAVRQNSSAVFPPRAANAHNFQNARSILSAPLPAARPLVARFHDRPVERRHQQMRAPFLPEILFDFREVIEVIPAIHVFALTG